MFLVNSHNPHFSATASRSGRVDLHRRRHTFSRSYGVNLPSSLTRVLSRALGYSPRPPESVCGTVTKATPRAAFLGSLGSPSVPDMSGPHHLSESRAAVCPYRVLTAPPTGLNVLFLAARSATLLRPCSFQRRPWWCRNINLLPITYAFRPRLRGRLTLSRLALLRKPWAFGEGVSHSLYRYSRLHYHFPAPPPLLSVRLTGRERSPTAPELRRAQRNPQLRCHA